MFWSRSVRVVLVGGLLTSLASAQSSTEKVLIRAPKPYAAKVKEIEARGGRVTHQFKYLDAIAAEVPRAALTALSAAAPAGAITKDLMVPNPVPVDTSRGRNLAGTGNDTRIVFDSVKSLSGADVASIAGANPNAYIVNNALSRVSALHAAGITGSGVIVAVIDSGIRPGFPHISLDSSVIGCEDFVGDGLGCSNFKNSGHGTFVAGMISANVALTLPIDSPFRKAVLAECPECFADPQTNTVLPMVGTAPLSSLYALRVFGPTGGSPESVILAAVERVIELREKYDAKDPSGVNIQVCNMSLGGPTVYAGRDLYDTAMDLMLRKGIVAVISAGNDGPANLTVGSPGTSFNALTVGAASLPRNERILRHVQYGPTDGPLYRPFPGVQTAYFSSRGPDADGRNDPDVTASGFACFGQGYTETTSGINIGSGTSFSTPSVAGVAALLRQAFPKATAAQIRNAIILGANRNVLSDGSTALDQGAGYVDAAAAFNLLKSGKAPKTFPSPSKATNSVRENVEERTNLRVRDGFVHQRITNLDPGEHQDILYQVDHSTGQVVVVLSNVTPSLPSGQQNQLFGDDILLAIHTAKTSATEADYAHFEPTIGGTFVLDNPERGIMRISVNGDWTNAGTVSADVTIFSREHSTPGFTLDGQIAQYQTLAIPVKVPAGTKNARFLVDWLQDWSRYPTSDIDMYVISPKSVTTYFDGASLNNPEAVSIDKPEKGTWTVLLDGFEIYTGVDRFKFRAELDGRLVH